MQIYKYNANSEIGIDILEKPEGYKLQADEFASLPAGNTPYKLIDGKLVASTSDEAKAYGKQWLEAHGYSTKPQLTESQATDAALMKQLALLTQRVNELEAKQ